MLKDRINTIALTTLMISICFMQAYGLDFVGFEQLAQSDTLLILDVVACDKWIDGKPTVLFRSDAYPDAKQYYHTVGSEFLYMVQYREPTLEISFVTAESLNTRSIIAGDFDEDGNVEIMGLTSFYAGEGTEITTMKYKAGSWTAYREIIPFYIERIIRVDLYDCKGDDFIFLYNALDLSHPDTAGPEIESPPLGLIYGNWESQRLNLAVDSTIHNAIESIGSICGDTTYVYIYEQFVDSSFVTLDGPRPVGVLAKYSFNRELSNLENLYHVKTPILTSEIVSDASSNLYVSDSLIQLFGDNLMQRYIDNGDSLTLSLFQWAPFPCFDPLLIDIDDDGAKELVCVEQIVTDRLVQGPNLVIKVYKLIE